MTTSEILAEFRKLRVLVAGDVCLDRWCRYDPALADPSRETGIPRIGVVATEVTPGAAGTIANNLAALGAGKVAVLGMVGDDGFGYELRAALAARGISHELLVDAPGIPTFTYTKLINARTDEEDLPRVDFVYTNPLPESVERRLLARLESAASDYDLILVSDQAETSQGGVVTPAMRDVLARLALARPDKLIWVDSRLRPEHFHYTVVKPNQQEAEAASVRVLGRVDYPELRRRMQAPLPDRHPRRKRRPCSGRSRRTVGARENRRQSGGHLRSGRQLQRRRRHGPSRHRRPASGHPLRQPRRRHHHHEKRHRHRLPRGSVIRAANVRSGETIRSCLCRGGAGGFACLARTRALRARTATSVPPLIAPALPEAPPCPESSSPGGTCSKSREPCRRETSR